jgi:hypothetical protein
MLSTQFFAGKTLAFRSLHGNDKVIYETKSTANSSIALSSSHKRSQHFICTHDETLFRLYDRAAVGVLVAVGAAVCVAMAVTVEVTDAVAVGRGVSVAVAVTVTGHGSRRRFGRSGRCRGCCDWRTSSGGQWRSGS